jgi:hypothetical protein
MHARYFRLLALERFWPTRAEAHQLYLDALEAGFPITHCPPAAWQLDPHPSPVRRELAIMTDELANVIRGLPLNVSGRATVARAYTRAVMAVSLARIPAMTSSAKR